MHCTTSLIRSKVIKYVLHKYSCCISSEGSVVFLFVPVADRALCCVLTGCQSSVRHLMLEGRVGVVSARAQAGQTSPRGPSGEANERNANAAKYQVCFYRSVCACVSVWDWQCTCQVWGWYWGQTWQAYISLCYWVLIITCGQNKTGALQNTESILCCTYA